MAESSPNVGTFKNHFYYETIERYIPSKPKDVHFVLNGENGPVKISAHKGLLFAASPILAAMFNGKFKEKGGVVIEDASAEGFEEFLQFFYTIEVNLTMKNIEDVLHLTQKFGLTECFATALTFLKKNLTSDTMVQGLELALKY